MLRKVEINHVCLEVLLKLLSNKIVPGSLGILTLHGRCTLWLRKCCSGLKSWIRCCVVSPWPCEGWGIWNMINHGVLIRYLTRGEHRYRSFLTVTSCGHFFDGLGLHLYRLCYLMFQCINVIRKCWGINHNKQNPHIGRLFPCKMKIDAPVTAMWRYWSIKL